MRDLRLGRTDEDTPRVVEDDGLFVHTIKLHSLDKIWIHNRYASVFTTAMRGRWPQMAYVGLYCGPGRARVDGHDCIVETSALAVVRQKHLFTHYIFVDHDEQALRTLEQRCRVIHPQGNFRFILGDVNDKAGDVRRALPRFSKTNGLLSFCFVDPFDTTLKFSTIRELSRYRIDFLILLMLGLDARMNLRGYLKDKSSTRIGDLIDCTSWREEFANDGRIVRFLLRKFDEAMQGCGYPGSTEEDIVPIKVQGKGVMIYDLVFYSQNDAGRNLWRKSVQSVNRSKDAQTTLF